MKAISVISAGLVWRIRTRKEIQILAQPWLNDKENPFVVTESPVLIIQKVASLLQRGSKSWDADIIRDIFNERDQHCITNTVVEHDLNSEILSWRLEESGQFSVRSAYKLIQRQKRGVDIK